MNLFLEHSHQPSLFVSKKLALVNAVKMNTTE